MALAPRAEKTLQEGTPEEARSLLTQALSRGSLNGNETEQLHNMLAHVSLGAENTARRLLTWSTWSGSRAALALFEQIRTRAGRESDLRMARISGDWVRHLQAELSRRRTLAP